MKKCNKYALVLGVFFATHTGSVANASYSEEVERSFPIRDRLPLEVDNRWGPISLSGWAGEQVRIRLVKKVEANSEAEAGDWLKRFQIHFEKQPKTSAGEPSMRLQVQMGKDGTILQRLQWQKQFQGEVELQIRAPYRLPAKLSTRQGAIQVKGWRGTVWARTESAPVLIEDQNSGTVSIETLSGLIKLTGIRSKVEAWSQSGKISLLQSEVSRSRLETESGAITANNVTGDLQITSQSGALETAQTNGKLELRSQVAPVTVSTHRGAVQVVSRDGAVHVSVESTSRGDSVDLISDRGSVELQAPDNASAQIQASSAQGTVETRYAVVPPELATRFFKNRQDAQQTHQVRGIIGTGTAEWRLETRLGFIRVSPRSGSHEGR